MPKPLVQQAFVRGSIDPAWLSFADFEKDLQHGIEHPEAEPLHPDGSHGPFGDTIAELSDWDCFQPKARRAETGSSSLGSLGMPHREPLRKVGRNDPCPCGSGKKFKKCCLNVVSEPFSLADTPGEPAGFGLRGR